MLTRLNIVLKAVEKKFVVLVLFLFTGALIPLAYEQHKIVVDAVHGDRVMQSIWFGVYLLTLCMVAVHWKLYIQIATKDRLLLLLLGIVLISIFWSVAPMTTLRRTIAMLGATVFGVYLGVHYKRHELLWLVGWTLGIAALLSVVFALGLPAYGVASGFDEGDWRGIYVHKNVLGRLMVVSGLAFLLIAMSCRSNCLIAWTLCGLSAAVLLASDSKTGLVIFLTVLVFLLLIKAGRWVYSRSLPFFITMVLASGGMATWFALNLNTVLRVLGRDMTLTGRTELWSVVLKMIWERPWFGYGYSAFWLGWQGESARVWLEIARWQPPHAHNGFLDLWLDVGLVGVAVFVLHFLAAYKRALSMARRAETAVGLWPLTYLTFMLLYNLMESTILGRNSVFFWALYVATTSSMLSQPATITEHGTAHCREDGASVEKQVEYNPNN